jgi:hypothetical protein
MFLMDFDWTCLRNGLVECYLNSFGDPRVALRDECLLLVYTYAITFLRETGPKYLVLW